jgi:hypothetical protein
MSRDEDEPITSELDPDEPVETPDRLTPSQMLGMVERVLGAKQVSQDHNESRMFKRRAACPGRDAR